MLKPRKTKPSIRADYCSEFINVESMNNEDLLYKFFERLTGIIKGEALEYIL